MSRRARTRQPSRSIQLEKLENREVFAGNILAVVNPVTNTIQLNGDNANNAVEVRSNFAGGTVITGLGGTKINGAAGLVVPLATPNLNASLNGGSDHIFIHDLAMNSLDINDQLGNNSVLVQRAEVYNNAVIATGAGADVVDFRGQVQGDVSVSTGQANDQVIFEGKVGVFLSPMGAPPVTPTLDITTGDGNDTVKILNSQILPSALLQVTTGAGDDVLESVNNDISGTLRVRMEAGKDVATIQTTDSLFADYGMGDGDDRLTLDAPSLFGTASIFDGGNGFDILDRGGVFVGAPVNFEVLI